MIFKQQFIFTKRLIVVPENCTSIPVRDYELVYHDTLSFNKTSFEKTSIYLLGDLFDYRNPKFTNADILNGFADISSKEELFKHLDPYCGAYILIYDDSSDFIILNDSSGQREIFYDVDFSQMGAQVGLLENLEEVDYSAHPYYGTALFNRKRLYIGETTPRPNVKHLRPNHYLDIPNNQVIRFFPREGNIREDLATVAQMGATMLNGFIEAIRHRFPLVIPLTGGMDSRMLFVASLDLDATYYISQHENDNDDYYDLVVAQQVAAVYDKPLQIIKDGKASCTFLKEPQGLDFPRDVSFPTIAINKAVINGNVSEVARNHFKYHKPVTGKKLALLNGFENNPFVIRHYDDWIATNKSIIQNKDYHLLDFFYWEENMMNWASKGKTETRALGVFMFSPFNSRGLLKLLLATDRDKRDTANNVVHAKILDILSEHNKELKKIPLNPDSERKRARVLWRLGLFKVFDAIRMELRLLKRKL